VQLKDILKEKRRGNVTKGVLFLHENAPAHRALATQKKLVYLGFHCLDHPPYSRDLAPSDYHLLPGLKKTIERSPFFVRSGDHFCRGDLVGRKNFWIFLSGLQKLGQRTKKCIELRGEYVEYIPSLVAVSYFLPVWAKDLSAPLRRSFLLGRVIWDRSISKVMELGSDSIHQATRAYSKPNVPTEFLKFLLPL